MNSDNVRRFLSFGVGFWPLFLLAGDVFPWLVYAAISLEAAVLDKPNKMAVLFKDAPGKRAPRVCAV
jgi:hypothetical protein